VTCATPTSGKGLFERETRAESATSNLGKRWHFGNTTTWRITVSRHTEHQRVFKNLRAPHHEWSHNGVTASAWSQGVRRRHIIKRLLVGLVLVCTLLPLHLRCEAGYDCAMNCEECDRLREALGKATDSWIKADNTASAAMPGQKYAMEQMAKDAKIRAATQRQKLAAHEATHPR
jgi:hypothetical protein